MYDPRYLQNGIELDGHVYKEFDEVEFRITVHGKYPYTVITEVCDTVWKAVYPLIDRNEPHAFLDADMRVGVEHKDMDGARLSFRLLPQDVKEAQDVHSKDE